MMPNTESPKSMKNFSGASNGLIGGLGPSHAGRELSGRALRRSHGYTRKLKPFPGGSVQAGLFAASQGKSQSAGAIFQPPISVHTCKPHWRKKIHKYARRIQRNLENE